MARFGLSAVSVMVFAIAGCTGVLQLNGPVPVTDLGFVASGSAIGKDGRLYVAEAASGALKMSADGGKSWTALHTFTSAPRTVHVAANGYIYTSPDIQCNSDCGLWRSTDGGITWSRVIKLGKGFIIWAFAEDSDGILYAGEYYNLDNSTRDAIIHRSTDHGADWSVVFTDPNGRHIHDLQVDDRNNIYASVGDHMAPWLTLKVFRSSDGTTWSRILTLLPQVVGIGITPTARIFGSDATAAQLYRTTDDFTFTYAALPTASQYNFWIRVDPDTHYIYAGFVTASTTPQTSWIYRSIDDGNTWSDFWGEPVSGATYLGVAYASNIVNGKMIIGGTGDARLVDLTRSDNYAQTPVASMK